MIYFDNSATTAIYPLALDTYVKTSQRIMGNPSSLHDLGTQASRLLQQARKQIAELLTVQTNEIFFTSGGTEGDNWVLKGTAIAKRDYGNHIIISSVEHPAISRTAAQLSELGYEVSIAPVDEKGFVIVDKLKELIRPETILVSVMGVNNEIGAIQPIEEISKVLESYPKIHFHVDAVQAIGKVDQAKWLTSRVDFATFSAHKFHGPRGVGFIYWKTGKKLAPLLNGGGQESGQRATTENLPAIVAMSRALRMHLEKKEERPNHTAVIRQYLKEALSGFDKVAIFSGDDNFAPHILTFGIKGIRGEVLVHALEEKQIFVSTTSACSSRKKVDSSTLHAMNVPHEIATTAVRVSLDEANTMAEAEQFMIVFNHLYNRFSKIN
ncbi:cysteine desulfurase family protein [Enterococcus raffinosus]|jgi:cysteine desulfurase|uniref:Cysteine desulfurase family protein n=1 Tax=Enterococcus raffinosus TaxID=71452 RepID=A0AAW8THA9_9ENTE|nr:cysteine desulfurase family protein [Enterococcus raffinosus]MDT2525427.1 cysteine desulfurase family protein [Enterococcus raffinosus]MDT2531586.1 cysteine desulfurase family protein [Enterococcus raffinosus]MDT2535937.1 cysteine desulfurase family protein [Enterococcus raffinosus]MDT2546487.1 cysteine desulfurase family protein [Enterococcus raffinosus]MDT2556274.1 cysteine desulfurase family protein [Enterococcus raffinosus]